MVCILQFQEAAAEVTVFSNRTHSPLTVATIADSQGLAPLELEIGESRAVSYRNKLRIQFGEGLVQQNVEVHPKSAYFFTRGVNGQQPLRLEQIGIGDDQPKPTRLAPVKLGDEKDFATVKIKILVDDDEPTHRHLWEGKLRGRIAAASNILERSSGIRLQVVAVGTWNSDDRQHDFDRSMREFEREVVPAPADLAIGFSSQYKVIRGRHHVGGSRGILYPYIMLKERSPKTVDRERLELLLHELGHYLGASHSPEPQSIMRPLLTSSLQRQAGSRIQYDPVNALLMALMGEEMRLRGVTRLSQVSRPTKQRMTEIYSVLVKALPKDPAATQYLQLLGHAGPRLSVARPRSSPDRQLANNSRRVLGQLVKAVEVRRPKPVDGRPAKWYEGDELSQFYVRRAALAAVQVEPDDIQRVYLVSLGVFMDSSAALRKVPLVSNLVSQIESEQLRSRKVQVLGTPTMQNRADLAQHFFLSAFLTATMGPDAALSIGLTKEMADANGGTGFSFADLAADRAGIEFAKQILAKRVALETVSERFRVADFMPPIDGLQEGLSMQTFKDQYGSLESKTFQAKLAEIDSLVRNLPAYRKTAR